MNFEYWNNCKKYYDNVLTDAEFDYELVIIEKESGITMSQMKESQ